MSDSSLGTTNLLLGIIAAVSVLQAVVLVGVAMAARKLYHRSLETLADARRQVEPLAARVGEIADRVNGIADDVGNVTSRIASATARAEAAVGTASVALQTLRFYGIARGLRAAYRSFIHPDAESAPF